MALNYEALMTNGLFFADGTGAVMEITGASGNLQTISGGELVTLYGNGFGDTYDSASVEYIGYDYISIIIDDWTNKRIVFLAPSRPDSNKQYSVKATNDNGDVAIMLNLMTYINEEQHIAPQILKSAGGEWNDDNLLIGDEYNVVRGIDFGLNQIGTATGSITGNAPYAPTNIHVVTLGTSSLQVSIDFNANTEYFSYYRATDISGTYSLVDSISATSIVDVGLSGDTEYWYKVKAVNAFGSSPFSIPSSGKTLSIWQAGRSFYYPKSIRRVLVALLDKFNGIQVQRYDDAGNFVKSINVPILFAPQEKYWQLNKRLESPYPNFFKSAPVPRLGVTFDGMNYSSGRSYAVNEVKTFSSPDIDLNLLSEYINNVQPSPYDFNFTVYIRTEYFNDFTQIVEQILPYFNPDLYLRIKEFSFLNLERDLKVEIANTNLDFLEPQEENNKRYINGSISVTVAGWMYRPISSEKLIKKITANFNLVDNDENILVSKYTVQENII